MALVFGFPQGIEVTVFTKKKQLTGRQQKLMPTIRKGPGDLSPVFYGLVSLGWASTHRETKTVVKTIGKSVL